MTSASRSPTTKANGPWRAEIGITIEGQEGLTWEGWRHICETAERLGFESLWRSDHFFSVVGEYQRDCIETWVSLALCAQWTTRITFGPSVSPMTFRPAAVLARMATAVDLLSGGRLILGVGAGWYQPEHEAFHIPYPPDKERADLLDEGIAIIRDVWERAKPQPPRGSIPLFIGGGGERRTLRTVAREADEWGVGTKPDLETYRHKCEVLAGYCRQLGRDPASIRRSITTWCIIGRNQHEVRQRAARIGEFFPTLRGKTPDEVIEASRADHFVGTPLEIVEQMRPYVELGLSRWQLQHFFLDDDDALKLLIENVAPALAAL